MTKEVAKHRTRLVVSAAGRSGPVIRDTELLSDTRLLDVGSEKYQVVELRIAIPTSKAETLFSALRSGDAELLIQDIP